MREMRRKDKQMPDADAWKALAEAESMTLCLADAGGNPYGVILSYALIGKVLYFHSAKSGIKCDLLNVRPQVCLTALRYSKNLGAAFDFDFISVTAFGKASLVRDEDERVRGFMAICEKYSPGTAAASAEYIGKHAAAALVYRVDIDTLSGKWQV